MLCKPAVTPRGYANAVQAHSEQSIGDSLYPGHNFASLASYLLEPYQSYASLLSARGTTADPRGQNDEFAAFYRLGKKGTERFRYVKKPEALYNMENDGASSGCEGSAKRTGRDEQERSIDDTSTAGKLLFLRGNASPKWLNHIGAKYRVDPEFFYRHRDFAATTGRPDYFSLPSLPSTNRNMLRLRVTTIGARKTRGGNCPVSQKELDALRKEARALLSDYFEGLSRERNSEAHLGKSVVRDFSAHDSEYFTIEQNVSVYIAEAQRGWIGIHPKRKQGGPRMLTLPKAIVWLDSGDDLSLSPSGPWRSRHWSSESGYVDYFPTIQHEANIALKSHRTRQPLASTTGLPRSHDDIPQSASRLHLNYGRELKPEIMACDPFYALHDLFRFVAFNNLQFFNLIKHTLRAELHQDSQALSNVIYNKQILERHVEYIQDIITFIQGRADCDWPRYQDHEGTAEMAIRRIVKDFEDLLARARAHAAECDTGMEIIMKKAMAQEAQNALHQAEKVAKLTKLAFFFVPLSFTAAIFGMNVTELGTSSSTHIWAWIAVSVPVSLVSFMFMLTDVRKSN